MTVLVGVDVLGRGATDLAFLDGRIVEPASVPGARRIDCRGLIALPGLVDTHAHLRDPGPGDAEDIATGSLAAARGGYTAVCAMPNTIPVADTVEVIAYERRRAAEAGLIDLVAIGAVTKGQQGRDLADIAAMGAAGVRMFSDDGFCVARSDVMRDALVAIAEFGGVLAQHAQDPLLTVDAQVDQPRATDDLPGWPAMAEAVIVARDAVMAAELGARVHVCHVSTASTVAVVRWAKSQGYPVTAEVTPHHLLLDNSTAGSDPAHKVNPPLRSAADIDACRAALVDGTIDAVGTDHAPHPPSAKERTWCEAANGMLGLETSLAVVADTLVATGRLTWAGLADRMSTAGAKIAGIADEHGGDLAVGRPATLVLVDPDRPWHVTAAELASTATNTPYEGLLLRTRPVATLLRGRVTHDVDQRFEGSADRD